MAKKNVMYFLISKLIILMIVSGCNETKSINVKFSSINIDTIYSSDTLIKKVEIYNESAFTVTIHKIISSCGCTTVLDGEGQKVRPTNDAIVKLKYVPDSIDSGLVKKTIVIQTDAVPKLHTLSFLVYVKR